MNQYGFSAGKFGSKTSQKRKR